MNSEQAAKQYRLFRAADFVCKLLPLKFSYWISLRLGDMFYRRDARGRTAVKANLRRVLSFRGQCPSEPELDLLARRTFQAFGKYLVDFFSYSSARKADVHRLVDVQNGSCLDELRQLDRGGLLVTAHLGNWELGGAIVASRGHPVTAVVLEQPEKRLDKLFQSYRRKRGLKVIHLGSAARPVLEALRRKEFVALLADRDYTARSRMVEFFGEPARLPHGPAWLSHRLHVPMMPGFLLRKEKDRFDLRLHPLINASGDMDEDQIQARLCAVMEEEIGRSPTQWFMFEDVWCGKPYGSG